MAQSEFRVSPVTGQRQKLNGNRRWENVDGASTSPLAGTVGGSQSSVMSDFSHGNAGTSGEDNKQIIQTADFADYLLEHGISPYDLMRGPQYDEAYDIADEYAEEKSIGNDNFDRIVKELSINGFDRARKMVRARTLADMDARGQLPDIEFGNIYKYAHHPVAVIDSHPDMILQYQDDMFSGDFAGTYDDYISSYRDNSGFHREQEDSLNNLVSEWSRRAKNNGFSTNTVTVTSSLPEWGEEELSVDNMVSTMGFQPPFASDKNTYTVWEQHEDGKTLVGRSISRNEPDNAVTFFITPNK